MFFENFPIEYIKLNQMKICLLLYLEFFFTGNKHLIFHTVQKVWFRQYFFFFEKIQNKK